MSDGQIRVSIDSTANACYIRLSYLSVESTVELTADVLVDLDENGMVVGIETLRIQADIPIEELVSRFHVRSEIANLLLSAEKMSGIQVSQGHDGYAAAAPQLMLA